MARRYGSTKYSSIAVSLNGTVPISFRWQGKTYRITQVITHWVEVAPWWIASALEKSVWRIEAHHLTCTGTYELTCLANQWFVTKVFD